MCETLTLFFTQAPHQFQDLNRLLWISLNSAAQKEWWSPPLLISAERSGGLRCDDSRTMNVIYLCVKSELSEVDIITFYSGHTVFICKKTSSQKFCNNHTILVNLIVIVHHKEGWTTTRERHGKCFGKHIHPTQVDEAQGGNHTQI